MNQPLEADITPLAPSDAKPFDAAEQAEYRRKMMEFFQQPPLGEIPLESLRRESMYEDRD